MKESKDLADVYRVTSRALVIRGAWAGLPRATPRARAVVRTSALVGGSIIWFACRIAFAGPAGRWAVLGGVFELLAWGSVIGVIAAASAQVVGREQAGWVAVIGTAAYGVWQHRLPTWFDPDLLNRLLGHPWAGIVWPPSNDPQVAVVWTAGWTLADLVWVVVIGVSAWHWLADVRPTQAIDAGTSYVLAALASIAVLVGITTSLSGLVDDGAASVQASATFTTDNVVPLLAATAIGLAGVRNRLSSRALLALFVGLGLDAVAGLLGGGDPWIGPQRLGIAPDAASGQLQTAPTILWLAVITISTCFYLMTIGPLARALRSLQARPGLGVLLALTANTIDALATNLGLRNGTMVEANPMVRLTGMTAKWVAVTILLVLLYRVRPRLVWIVTAAYLLVVAYHLVGVLLLA